MLNDDLSALSFAEYRAHPAIAQSDLVACGANPEEWRARRNAPVTWSDAMFFGTGFENWLWNGCFPSDWLEVPASALAANGHRRGKAYEAFVAENAGKHLFSAANLDYYRFAFERAAQQVAEHGAANAIAHAPDIERSRRFLWVCPETGLQLKAELDLIVPSVGAVVDLKTSADVDAASFGKSVANWSYHVQAAHYLDAARGAGYAVDSFVWIVVRNKAPFNVEVYQCAPALLEAGRKKLAQLKQNFARCSAANQWRSETHGKIAILEGPVWIR